MCAHHVADARAVSVVAVAGVSGVAQWLCGASKVVKLATDGPCGVAARGAQAADVMARHETHAHAVSVKLVPIATEHDATTSILRW